jgi:hypothetical protein
MPAVTVTFVHDPVFCIDRAIVRTKHAKEKLGKLPPSSALSSAQASLSITLHYLREVRRGLQK